jgi:hypothetical protein
MSAGWDYAFVGVKIPLGTAHWVDISFLLDVFLVCFRTAHRYLPLGCGKKMDIGFSWRPGLVLDKKTYLE